MTTQAETLAAIRAEQKAHEIWDVAEHAALRLAHETDYRELVSAINNLRTAMQGEANKIVFVMLGGTISTVGGVLFFVLPHIH